MVAKLLPYSVKKILHYQLKPRVSRGSVGVTVGVSVRGSVDTTLTPAEYIVFKGFSDNISILGVGVAHKNNCALKIVSRKVVSLQATRRFSDRDTTKWIAVTDIDFQTLIIHEHYIYNVVFPFCLRRYINDREWTRIFHE